MKKLSHSIFLVFLLVLGIVTAVTISLRNYDYYLTPLDQRPFHPRYEQLKPSGIESHGYGVVGAAMIIVGVATYSTRKRVISLSSFGNIRRFLQIHIFLCLVGPILVLYHTTFKFGGLVAVGFWSMAAVVASGFIGRYFYRHIPRNIEGRELSIRELEEQRANLLMTLRTQYGISDDVISSIENIGIKSQDEENVGFGTLVWSLLRVDLSRFRRVQALRGLISHSSVDKHVLKEIVRLADERIVLRQRISLLEKVHEVFHYWHIIHVPFSITLFVILAIHVGVAVAFGYTWML
jgi:hypothetical protein